MPTTRPLINYEVSCGKYHISLADDDTISSPVEQSIKVSYKPGFNSIKVSYTSSISLSYMEARVTDIDAQCDIGVGTKVHSDLGNIAGNTPHTFYIDVNQINFPHDGAYRVSFYAKSSIDGTWTYKYLVFQIASEGGQQVKDLQLQDVFALTDKSIPN